MKSKNMAKNTQGERKNILDFMDKYPNIESIPQDILESCGMMVHEEDGIKTLVNRAFVDEYKQGVKIRQQRILTDPYGIKRRNVPRV